MVIYKSTKYYVHKNTNMFSPNLRHLINFEIIYFSYIFLFHYLSLIHSLGSQLNPLTPDLLFYFLIILILCL